MGEIKKFETVQDWLESDNPEEYDFVEDAQGKKATLDYGEIEGEYGVYERFLVYKYKKIDWSNIEDILQGKANLQDIINEYDTRDPDSYSGLLQSIYRKLWPDLVESDFMKAGKNTVYSDTMTSASTTFRHALEAIINLKDAPKNIDENIINTIRTIYKNCDAKSKRGQVWWSDNFTILVAAVLGEEFYEIISNYYPGMKGFLESYHTVGNFCPVPGYFNGARSHGKCDYWDLTLMKIREWYEYDREEGEDRKEEKKDCLNKLLHIKTDCPRNNACRENCEKWLNMFSSWEDFVDTFYMQDFVYCEENLNKKYQFSKDDKNYYEVIPFWDKHGWDEEKGRCLPESEDKINEIFKTMADMINNRSKRIVNVLKDISNKR